MDEIKTNGGGVKKEALASQRSEKNWENIKIKGVERIEKKIKRSERNCVKKKDEFIGYVSLCVCWLVSDKKMEKNTNGIKERKE